MTVNHSLTEHRKKPTNKTRTSGERKKGEREEILEKKKNMHRHIAVHHPSTTELSMLFLDELCAK